MSDALQRLKALVDYFTADSHDQNCLIRLCDLLSNAYPTIAAKQFVMSCDTASLQINFSSHELNNVVSKYAGFHITLHHYSKTVNAAKRKHILQEIVDDINAATGFITTCVPDAILTEVLQSWSNGEFFHTIQSVTINDDRIVYQGKTYILDPPKNVAQIAQKQYVIVQTNPLVKFALNSEVGIQMDLLINKDCLQKCIEWVSKIKALKLIQNSKSTTNGAFDKKEVRFKKGELRHWIFYQK